MFTNAMSDRVRVFISYTHDSEPHKQRVLALANELRNPGGLDCRIDQFVQGTPEEGWPKWMNRQIEDSHYVLMVCTETYERRFNGNESPNAGKGGQWEGAVITNHIYNNATSNKKFVPVIFDYSDEENIPHILTSATHYKIPELIVDLCRYLTDQPLYVPAEIASPQVLPPKGSPGFSDVFPSASDRMLTDTASGEPIRFNWDDLNEVICALHDTVVEHDVSGDSRGDFSDLELRLKNELNGMGRHYFETSKSHYEPYFREIQDFLEDNTNLDVKDLYFDVVDELRMKIAGEHLSHSSFEDMLLAFREAAIANTKGDGLRQKRVIISVLINFMYFNCDIGIKE